jgi:hypothetical protein
MIVHHDIHDLPFVIAPFTPDLMPVWRDESKAMLIQSIVLRE